MSRGRKATIGGRLASVGARALRFEAIARKHFPLPPDHFDDVAADAYWMFVTQLAEARELSVADAPLIEMAASAYSRWLALDRLISADEADEGLAALRERLGLDHAGARGEVGEKGFMSGPAQARAAAAKEYRTCAALLGGSPVDRIKTSGALQSNFLDLLDEKPKSAGAADDPFADPKVIAGHFGEQ